MTAAKFQVSSFPLDEVIEAEFNATQLRELAKWLDLKLKGTSKSGFVDQVVAVLNKRVERMKRDPEAVLEGLNDEQQDFVRRMLTARDRELPLPRKIALNIWAKKFEREGERKLIEMFDVLRRRALLFPVSPFQYGTRDVYYQWLPLSPNVPVANLDVKSKSDLGEHASFITPSAPFLQTFDAFLNVVMKHGVTLRAPLPQHKQISRYVWLRDWEHDIDEAESVIHSRPGWVPDPQTGISVQMLSPLTHESAAQLEKQTGLSRPHLEFLFALACAMQLIEAPMLAAIENHQSSKLKSRASAVEEWLVLTDEQKLRRAWKAWTEDVHLGIEAHIAIGVSKTAQSFTILRAVGARDFSPQILAAEWCSLRRFVARVLRGIPSNRWVNWEDFRERIFDFYPECAWTFSTRAEWWFASASKKTRLNPLKQDEWNASVGTIIEHILQDTLAWFGAVEAAIDSDANSGEQLRAFRLTELGAWLIGSGQEALPQSVVTRESAVEPITWSKDNTTIYVQPAPNRAEFVGMIRRVADRAEGAFAYVITPSSIERALNEGLTLDQVTKGFKRANVPLPKRVTEQFNLAARRFGRVRVYESLTVLELADDLTAKELAANTSLMQRIAYQLSLRAFVVKDEDVDVLIEEMQAKGYTPRVKN